MEILFDFEIYPHLEREVTDMAYDLIRDFYTQKTALVAKEIDNYIKPSEYAVFIISIHEDTLTTIPFNIPPHLIEKLNACITEEEFDAFQDRIIALGRPVRYN